MAKKVILSADSPCDLRGELGERYSVNFYPFHIVLDGKQYMDSVDIFPEDLVKIYREKKLLPKTAAINVQEYVEYFRPFIEQGYEVVHINIGSALSGAYQNCCVAAEELGGVYPINSCNLSTGIGHLVIQAAERIEKGMSAKEISDEVKALVPKVHSSFILDTLEFMHEGGRCSMVAALGANLLRLKPCIEVDNQNNGAMGVGKKYRGPLDKVLAQYTREKLAQYDNIDDSRIFITHSPTEPGYADVVRRTINEVMPFKEIFETNASCTISSHCGPNTVGILFMTR